MSRSMSDAPGPGQAMAVRIIEIAERLVAQGNSISIRWTPAHRGVEGNKQADRRAKETVALPPLRTTARYYSLAFLRRRATERATSTWGKEIEQERGRRTSRLPTAASRLGIRPQLRAVTKGVAARFF